MLEKFTYGGIPTARNTHRQVIDTGRHHHQTGLFLLKQKIALTCQEGRHKFVNGNALETRVENKISELELFKQYTWR